MAITSFINIQKQSVNVSFDETTLEIKKSKLANEPFSDYPLDGVDLEMANDAIRRVLRTY